MRSLRSKLRSRETRWIHTAVDQVLLHASEALLHSHVDLIDLTLRHRVHELVRHKSIVRALGLQDLILLFKREVRVRVSWIHDLDVHVQNLVVAYCPRIRKVEFTL